MRNTITLSVIIPLYNHQSYIQELITSFSDESRQDIELVIVDDFSTDNSFEQASLCLQSSNITYKLLRNQQNSGVAFTLNRGIYESRGEYITSIASDDMVDVPALIKRVEFLQAKPDTLATIGDFDVVDGKETVAKQVLKKILERTGIDELSRKKYLLKHWGLQGGLVLMRRSLFEKIGFYDTNLMHEDWEFFLRLVHNATVTFDLIPFLKYRVHQNNFHKKNRIRATLEHIRVTFSFLVKHSAHRVELTYRLLSLIYALVLYSIVTIFSTFKKR